MGKNNNGAGKGTVTRPSYLLFLALFTLMSVAGFVAASLLGGSSNIAGTANYTILALLLTAPIMMIGNGISLRKGYGVIGTVVGRWLRHIAVFAAGMLIYVIFALIIAKFGTFRMALYKNGVLNAAMFGVACISFAMLVTAAFEGKIGGYVCLYALAAALIVIEVLMGVTSGTGSALHSALYAVSISKLTYCMRLGITDWKTISLYCLVTLFSLAGTVQLLKLRSGGKRFDFKSFIVPALLLAAVVVLVVLPNGAISGRDVTPAGFFTISSEPKEYIDRVKGDVTVTVADTESGFVNKSDYSTYFVHAERIINAIGAENEHITVKYDPKAVDTYGISVGDIAVEGPGGVQKIRSSDLFNFDYSYNENGDAKIKVASSRAEEAICSAIHDALDTGVSRAAFLQNGSEDERSKNLAALLEDRGYEIVYVDVNTEKSVPDVKLAVIFAPTEDYDSTVILENYMFNGGEYGHSLLYVANSDTSLSLPKLDSFLELWGVAVSGYTVIETDPQSFTNDSEYWGLNEYIEYSFISDYTYLEAPAVVPYSKYIVTDSEKDDMTYRTLLQSKGTCRLTDGTEIGGESENYITALIASYYQKDVFGNGYTGVESHVAVIGSEMAFDSAALGGDYSNARYFADAADELAGKNTASVAVHARSLRLGGMEMTEGQIKTAAALLAIIPAAFTIAFIAALVMRKKQRI